MYTSIRQQLVRQIGPAPTTMSSGRADLHVNRGRIGVGVPPGSRSRGSPKNGMIPTMAEAARDLRGIVRGKVIELDRDPGLPEGEAVVVKLQPLVSPLDGIRRSAGAWAEDAEALDEFLAEVRRSRHAERGASRR